MKPLPNGNSVAPQMRHESYRDIVRLDELLRLQGALQEHKDGLLFVAFHQVSELWFSVVIRELTCLRAALSSDRIDCARANLRRILVVESLLVCQFDVLDTMDPRDFLAMRPVLGHSSAAQSWQFKEIEILSGLRDRHKATVFINESTARAHLLRRLDEPSVWEEFSKLIVRRGLENVLALYRDREWFDDLYQLAELLFDHDQLFARWRFRHMQVVERQIGRRSGTGGSPGVEYLATTLSDRFYPALSEARASVTSGDTASATVGDV